MRGLLVWSILLLVGWNGVLLAYRAGSRLPVEHRASVSGVVEAAPGRVWEMLAENLAHDQWRTGVRRVQTVDPQWIHGRVCWTEYRASMPIPLCVAEEQREVRRVVKTAEWAGMPFAATWTYEMAAAGSGTRVTITEDATIQRPLWRFYGRYGLRGRTEVAQELMDLQREGLRRR